MKKQHFLEKLYDILNNNKYNKYNKICSWTDDGTSFYINKQHINKFMNIFNIKSMDSFKRKLYFYKFKTLKNILNYNDCITFFHPHFNKNTKVNLDNVTRKSNIDIELTNLRNLTDELNELKYQNLKVKMEIDRYKNIIEYNDIILKDLINKLSNNIA